MRQAWYVKFRGFAKSKQLTVWKVETLSSYMELAIPSRFWLFLFVFFIVSTSLSKEPKHTSLSHTQKPQCCCVFLAYLMFLNCIHHSNKIFCSKLKNSKIRSLSLAETISSNLTRPWLFFFFFNQIEPIYNLNTLIYSL